MPSIATIDNSSGKLCSQDLSSAENLITLLGSLGPFGFCTYLSDCFKFQIPSLEISGCKVPWKGASLFKFSIADSLLGNPVNIVTESFALIHCAKTDLC